MSAVNYKVSFTVNHLFTMCVVSSLQVLPLTSHSSNKNPPLVSFLELLTVVKFAITCLIRFCMHAGSDHSRCHRIGRWETIGRWNMKTLLYRDLCTNGFQMQIKRPTSGGQARDQETAVQRTFHLERNSFSTNGKDSTQHLLACILYTAALNTDPDSCPPEVKPRSMKTICTLS